MMKPSFNLVDSPWVPVEYTDGTVREVSLRDAFADARSIRRVTDQSPLVTAAVYRLLFAIMHRALPVTTDDAWVDAWDAYEVAGPATAYLERWRHRFEVFDEDAPFAQVRDLPDKCRFPWTKLALDRAPNSSKLLFDHTYTLEPPPTDPATAVRSLLACQAFTVGAGKSCTGYTSGAPLSGVLTVIPEGRDLAETLLANVFSGHFEDDSASWEAEPLTVSTLLASQESRTWTGPASRLTWLSRAVKLVPEDENGNVRWALFGMGLKPIVPDGDRDPWVSYRTTKDGVRVPLKLDPNRLIWRDLHAMLHGRAEAETEPVRAVTRLAGLGDASRRPPQAWTLVAAGHAADRASVLAWRLERWTVPAVVVGDPDRASGLYEALRLAEATAHEVGRAVWKLAAALAGEDRTSTDVKAVANGIPAERTYWAQLSSRFQRFLNELGADRDVADAYWREAVAAAVANAAAAAHRAIGRDVKAIKAWAQVSQWLAKLSAKALEPTSRTGGERS